MLGGSKSSRGNQILDIRHLARRDRKRRCLSRFSVQVVPCGRRHSGLRGSIPVAPITDKSRLEDKATTLTRAGSTANGRQSSGHEEDTFLRGRK